MNKNEPPVHYRLSSKFCGSSFGGLFHYATLRVSTFSRQHMFFPRLASKPTKVEKKTVCFLTTQNLDLKIKLHFYVVTFPTACPPE